MASGGDKTEKATPKRREEARKKGQVAKSQDLNGALVLIGGLIALVIWAPHMVEKLAESMRGAISVMANPRAVTASTLAQLGMQSGKTIAFTVGPIALTCMFAGLVGNV